MHGAIALSPEPHRTKNLNARRFQFGLRLLNVVDEELGHGAGRYMRLRLQARPPQLDLIPIRELEPNEVVRLLGDWEAHHIREESRHHVRLRSANSEEHKPLRLHAILLLRLYQPHDDRVVSTTFMRVTFTYRLHDTTGDDVGLLEHPAPNLEPGDVLVLADGREALTVSRASRETVPVMVTTV